MRVVFIPLATLVLSDEVCDIFFHVIKMAVSLYSLHYICYTRVSVFFGVIVSSNTVPYLFLKYMKFFF